MNALITWIKGNWFTIILAVLLVVAACGLLSTQLKLLAVKSTNTKLVELNKSASGDVDRLKTDIGQLTTDRDKYKSIAEQLRIEYNKLVINDKEYGRIINELTKQVDASRTAANEAISIINGQK